MYNVMLGLLSLPSLLSVLSVCLTIRNTEIYTAVSTFPQLHCHTHEPRFSSQQFHPTPTERTMAQTHHTDSTTSSKSEPAAQSAAEPTDGPASPTLIAALVDHTKHLLQLTEGAIQTLHTQVALTKAQTARLSSQTQDLETQHKLRALK